MPWDTITLFGGDEETAVFGARIESGNALYHIDTAATISCSEEVKVSPHVVAIAGEITSAVAADCQLSIFQDDCHKILVSLNFDSIIDQLACDKSGEFLVVGEQSGYMHLLHVPTQKTLFSKKLASASADSKGPVFRQIAFECNDSDRYDLVAVLEHKVFVFSNVSLDKISAAIKQKDIPAVKILQDAIVTVAIDASHTHTECFMGAVRLSGTEQLITFGAGSEIICLWKLFHGEYSLQDCISCTASTNIVKCVPTASKTFMITLDTQGAIALWSFSTFVQMRVFKNIQAEDFLLIDTCQDQNSSWTDQQIVILTKPLDHGRTVMVADLPSLSPVYTLQLSHMVHLAYTPSNFESIFIMEGVAEGPNSCVVTTLRFCRLSEALPETQFHRLIHKLKFREAETFAALFRLDVELVHKAEVMNLLDQLSPWKSQHLMESDVQCNLEYLWSCLPKIKDESHYVHCCVSALLPTYASMLHILDLAENKVEETKETVGDVLLYQSLMQKVQQNKNQLMTYHLCLGPSKYSNSDWQHFRSADMLKMFVKSLQEKDLDSAFIIWSRYQNEFAEKMSPATLTEILNLMPDSGYTDQVKNWLQHGLIPFLLKHLPDGIMQLATWMESRIRIMEVMEKAAWPQNGISWCELLLSQDHIAWDDAQLTPRKFAIQRTQWVATFDGTAAAKAGKAACTALDHLWLLWQQVQQIQHLEKTYKCRMTLAQFAQEDVESITYRMLDKVVAIELVVKTIDTVIRRYMLENNLHEDKVLCQYIQDLSKHAVQSYGEALWESKAIAVISCIKDIDFKCQAILDAMKRAALPWSKEMVDLVNSGLALNHPRVVDIKEQCRLTELRKLLISYDLQQFNVADSSRAQMLIKFMLVKDRPSAMQDALFVIDIYHMQPYRTYEFRLKQLISCGRLIDAMDLLKSRPRADACRLGNYVISYTHSLLARYEDHTTDEKKLVAFFTEIACQVVPFIISISIDLDEIHTLNMELPGLRKVQALQKEFGEFLPTEELDQMQVVDALIRKHMLLLYKTQYGPEVSRSELGSSRSKETADGTSLNLTRIFRLAELLNKDKYTLLKAMIDEALDLQRLSLALEFTNRLLALPMCPNGAEVLYQVAHVYCGILAEKGLPGYSNLPQLIKTLLTAATATIPQGLLCDCMELKKVAEMAYQVVGQCMDMSGIQDSMSGEDAEEADPMVHQDITIHRMYSDEGLIMDPDCIVPLVYEFCTIWVPNAAKRIGGLQYNFCGIEETFGGDSVTLLHDLTSAVHSIGTILKENGHLQLALAYTNVFIKGVLRHVATQDMGYPIIQEDLKQQLQENVTPLCSDIVKYALTVAQELETDILTKVLSRKRVDHHLALTLLEAIPSKPDGLLLLRKAIDDNAENHKKAEEIAVIGIEFARMCNNTRELKYFAQIKTNALWGQKLAKLKIPFKSNAGNAKSFDSLLKYSAITAKMVKEFCIDYDISIDKGLNEYIVSLLTTPLPQSDPETMIKTITGQLDKARAAAKQVDRTELMDRILCILNKMSCYDYERLSFVLEELVSPDITGSASIDQGLALLKFLNSYDRLAPPSEYELSYSIATEEVLLGGQQLPVLAKKRLPYHPLIYGELWKIISPELNADTICLWVTVADILHVSKDEMYMIAVENIVKEHKAFKSDSQNQSPQMTDGGESPHYIWHHDDRTGGRLSKQINSLLLKIEQSEKALHAANYVIKELPMGSDKVLALQAAVNIAKHWMNESHSKSKDYKEAEQAYVMYRDFYLRLSTEKVLYQYGLANEVRMALASKPVELVEELYKHPDIPAYVLGKGTTRLPDMHAAIQEIASLYEGISLENIQTELIKKWMVPVGKPATEDQYNTFNNTFTMDQLHMNAADCSTEVQDHINLLRIIYICVHTFSKKNCGTLFRFLHLPDCETSIITRVRAIQCLCKVYSRAGMLKKFASDSTTLPQEMESYLYLSALEQLHIPQSKATFEQARKDTLAVSIWKKHSRQPQAVRMVVDLCLDYNVQDVNLWNSMLQKIQHLQMTDYLKAVLLETGSSSSLWALPCLSKVWRNVLMSHLTGLSAPLTAEQIQQAENCVAFLPRCPVLHNIDVCQVVKQYIQLEQPYLALTAALMIPDQAKMDQFTHHLLDDGQHLDIVKALDGKVLPLTDQVYEAVFKHIDQNAFYEVIDKTPFVTNFVTYLIEQRSIDRLLIHLLNADRIGEASVVVAKFMAYHSMATGMLVDASSENQLKLYLKHQGLLHHLPIIDDTDEN